MNGVHDMGGMHGFGPVVREENEPVFHADWEGACLAPSISSSAGAGLLQHRRVPPRHRAHAPGRVPARRPTTSAGWRRSSAIWSRRASSTRDELEARVASLREHPDAEPPPREQPRRPQRRATPTRRRRRRPRRASRPATRRDAQRPPGRPHPAAALRARQARRDPPRVTAPQIFPDTNAHGWASSRRPLYSVRFEATRTVGRLGRAAPGRPHRPVGELPRPRPRRRWRQPAVSNEVAMTYDPEQEPYVALRTKALESLLIEKGLLTAEAVDERISQLRAGHRPAATARGSSRGPGSIPRSRRGCWPTARARSPSSASPSSAHARRASRTRRPMHNMVVCTLCSCYPVGGARACRRPGTRASPTARAP